MGTVIQSRAESLHEILRRPKERLGDLFYQVFFEQCPEVQAYFKRVDLRVQATMLVNALHVIASHATHRYPATADYLRVLGHRHYLLRIPADLYPKFTAAMLTALEQFHGESWSPELGRLWREAFDFAVEAMLTGYADGPMYY